MGEKYIKVRFAADLMGISEQAVYKAIEKGTLPGLKEEGKKNGGVQIPVSNFLEFLASEKIDPLKKLRYIEEAEKVLRRL